LIQCRQFWLWRRVQAQGSPQTARRSFEPIQAEQIRWLATKRLSPNQLAESFALGQSRDVGLDKSVGSVV
jgi:hypothetical protein